MVRRFSFMYFAACSTSLEASVKRSYQAFCTVLRNKPGVVCVNAYRCRGIIHRTGNHVLPAVQYFSIFAAHKAHPIRERSLLWCDYFDIAFILYFTMQIQIWLGVAKNVFVYDDSGFDFARGKVNILPFPGFD